MTKQLRTRAGRAIAYREWGRPDRPVALLLHGLTLHGSTWDLVGPGLGEQFRVIALDARGHGDSDWSEAYDFEGCRDDVVDAMDELGVLAAVVVGHSIGAFTAYLLAATRPDQVRGLVLEDPPPLEPADPPKDVPTGPEPGEITDWRAIATAMEFRNAPDQAWWAYAEQIRCQTLVLGGERSYMPQKVTRRLAKKIPRGSFRSMPAGHEIHGDRPGEFLAVVLPFLTGCVR